MLTRSASRRCPNSDGIRKRHPWERGGAKKRAGVAAGDGQRILTHLDGAVTFRPSGETLRSMGSHPDRSITEGIAALAEAGGTGAEEATGGVVGGPL